jgi:hypothetical protein
MAGHRLDLAVIVLGVLGATAARADLETDLADLRVRAAYGFYAQEPAIVEAARAGLEQLPDSSPRVSYERGLAAFRLALLHAQRGKPAGALLAACIESAERAGEQDPASAEPWILVGACAAFAARAEPVKALLHGRRFDQALGRARAMDAANPRIPLVEAWRVTDDPAQIDAAAAAALAPRLEAAVATFAARSRAYAVPDWGEAETLVLLGALYLRGGDIRSARDVVEQALITAPGYAQALDLRRKLEEHFVGARRPSSL